MLIALPRYQISLTFCTKVRNGNQLKVKSSLTLRGLSLFFKILPISNTGVSAAYILATVHFLYPTLCSFSDMEYYFYQLAYRDSKVPKCFVGLKQMQCSPSFDCNWGKQNDPTACWHQHDFGFYSKGNASATHQIAWAGSLNPQLCGRQGAVLPSNPH